MNVDEIFETVESGENEFQAKCKKFSGTLTVETIKNALKERGIVTSPRDVFIEGLPIEIDFLIARKGAEIKYNTFYRPEDVIFAFEVKRLGSFGEGTIKRLLSNYQRIKNLNENIHCIYVTLVERKGFKLPVTEANTGFKTYTLFWHHNDKGKQIHEPTNDWESLVDYLKEKYY